MADFNRLFENMEKLCNLEGVSGREHGVRGFIISKLKDEKVKEYVTYKTDALGNLIVNVEGKQKSGKKLLFEAHMDEVGFIITGITDKGFLRFSPVGGIDGAVVFGRRVLVNGQPGVIAGKAIHQCSAEERKSEISLGKYLIDIGADSREEAEKLVSVGDVAVFDSEFSFLNSEFSEFIKSPALDDRAGCALLLELIESRPEYDLTVAFSVQEEVGLRGAAVLGNKVKPDIAVIIDSTTASDISTVSDDKKVCYIGKGAVVPFMDRRTLYDSELYKLTMKLAEEKGIKVQTKQMVAGGTNAGAIQMSGEGVRVIGVSLPCRYLHSAVSLLSKEDVLSAYNLLDELLKTLSVG